MSSASLKPSWRPPARRFRNVAALNIYVTDIRFRETITKVRREILKAPYPATTLVEVSSLASEDWLVEIDGVAGLD